MMSRFSTAVSALTLAAFISSNSRADEFALLQDWFAKPESTRGEVPAQLHGFSFTQDVIVIIAVHLRSQLRDAIADAGRLAKVHERPFERSDLSRRYQTSVRWGVAFSRYPQDVIQAAPAASQVPISMTAQIRNRGFIGLGFIVNPEFVLSVKV